MTPSSELVRYMDENLEDSPFFLTINLRAATHDAICYNAASHRFYIDALNVRRNHVHAVVCAFDGRNAEQIVANMKNAAGNAIRKRIGVDVELKIWTKSFGVNELHDIASWHNCVRYTLFKQGSNLYMSRTQFAKLRGIECDERGEPTEKSLVDAFNYRTNAFYRTNLFNKTP